MHSEIWHGDTGVALKYETIGCVTTACEKTIRAQKITTSTAHSPGCEFASSRLKQMFIQSNLGLQYKRGLRETQALHSMQSPSYDLNKVTLIGMLSSLVSEFSSSRGK